MTPQLTIYQRHQQKVHQFCMHQIYHHPPRHRISMVAAAIAAQAAVQPTNKLSQYGIENGLFVHNYFPFFVLCHDFFFLNNALIGIPLFDSMKSQQQQQQKNCSIIRNSVHYYHVFTFIITL